MERFLTMLMECTLTMSAIALLLLAFGPKLTKRYRARSVYIAWLIVLVGFAIPYRPQAAPAAIHVQMPPNRVMTIRREPAPAPDAYTEALLTDASPSVAQVAAGDVSSNTALPMEQHPPEVTARTTPVEISIPTLLFTVWVAGAAISAGIRLLRHRRFLRAVRRWSKPITSEMCHAELQAVQAALGIHRQVGLYRCKVIDSPMLVGILRPRILLPEAPLFLAEIHLVLKHELTHLRHRDLWGRVLLLAASTVHWFNPMLYPIAKAVGLQCEAACDAAVTQGMDLDTRQYYSETILHSLRSGPGMTTVLSTRYHGGIKMMKRRIVQILDLQHKRLGTVIVSLLLIATLGTGMAFAINTDGGVPADNEARVKALNNQLALSFSRWGALSTIDPDIGSYQFAFEEVSEADYLALMGMLQELYILPQEEATKAWQMIRSFEVQVPTAPPELYTAVDTLIAATGYDMQAEGEYAVAAESYASQMLTWEPPAIAGSWTVEVDWQDEDALRSVLTVFDQDGRWSLQDMQLFSGIYYLTPDPIEGMLTDVQRASAKARAAEFVGAHMRTVDPTCQHMIASDHVFTYWTEEGFIGEPCALIWVFETAWGDTGEPFYALPYEQPGTGEGNRGYKLAVELASGRIVAVERFVNETAFVNEYWAEMEWVALGHEYPYPDGSYIANTISPWVFAMVHDYLVAYGAELTEEDRMLSGFIAGSRNSLCSDSDWRRLLADLQSVQSAADFQAVLHADYIGINHPWEGMLSRDEVIALIMPSIEALGYGDMRQHMSIEYENTRQPEEAIVYVVKVSDTLFPNNPIPLPGQEVGDVPSPIAVETVRFEVDGQGNLLSIRNSGIASFLMTEREGLREMTEEEEALLMETARMMAESHLGGYEDIDLEGMQYFQVVNTSRMGRQVAKVHIPFGEVDERESLHSSGEYVRNKIVLGVDMETGTVLSMVTDRTEIDPDGEIPAMYWN